MVYAARARHSDEGDDVKRDTSTDGSVVPCFPIVLTRSHETEIPYYGK